MPSGSGPSEHWLLLSRFLKSPRQVGAIAPSSQALALEMVKRLPERGPATIVELGPGTGAFTDAIVTRLGDSARLLAIEIEPLFVERIRERWPSVECIQASAADLTTLAAERQIPAVDHIVSGLPFASLPGAVTQQIMDAIGRTLRSGGTFTTFQYVHAFQLPPAVTFRREMSERLGGEPSRHLVVRNVPPAWVLSWTKP